MEPARAEEWAAAEWLAPAMTPRMTSVASDDADAADEAGIRASGDAEGVETANRMASEEDQAQACREKQAPVRILRSEREAFRQTSPIGLNYPR